MDEFIKQLLKDSGVSDDMDAAVREQLQKDLTDRLTDFLNKRIVESMDEKTLAEFEQVIDQNGDDAAKIQTFIEQNVANREQIAASAILEFRALYLGDKA